MLIILLFSDVLFQWLHLGTLTDDDEENCGEPMPRCDFQRSLRGQHASLTGAETVLLRDREYHLQLSAGRQVECSPTRTQHQICMFAPASWSADM